ncbi:hypothetical protein J6G99_08610 [bacterium]|nr:hypothetical protein [bacterium]
MNVQRVNNTNNIAMNGNIISKNVYSTAIDEAVKKSDYFRKLSQNNDVVVRMDYKMPKDGSLGFLFKIKYSVLKENSIIDKMLDTLHLKSRKEYNNQYKMTDDLIEMLKS